MNFERHKAFEVEREGTKPYRGKAESHRLSMTSKVAEQVESDQSTAFLSVVACTEKKDAWSGVNLKVKRMRIDTGADVTIIIKKTWLAMKDKPRLEPTAVRLNSVTYLLMPVCSLGAYAIDQGTPPFSVRGHPLHFSPGVSHLLLNSVGGQLNAFGQFMTVTKLRNTVYHFNVIVIE